MKIGTEGEKKHAQILTMTVNLLPDLFLILKKHSKETPKSSKMEHGHTKVFFGIIRPHFES